MVFYFKSQNPKKYKGTLYYFFREENMKSHRSSFFFEKCFPKIISFLKNEKTETEKNRDKKNENYI